jgi:hypothetical protein
MRPGCPPRRSCYAPSSCASHLSCSAHPSAWALMHLGADGQALAGGAQAQELHLRRLLIGNRLLARGALHEARVAYARRRPLPLPDAGAGGAKQLQAEQAGSGFPGANEAMAEAVARRQAVVPVEPPPRLVRDLKQPRLRSAAPPPQGLKGSRGAGTVSARA